MKVVRINAGEFGSNCWLVFGEATGGGVIIDPSPEIDVISDALDKRGVRLHYILLTHGHFDHMTSCDTLRDLTGAPLCIHKDDAECLTNSRLNASRLFSGTDLLWRPADVLLSDGSVLDAGDLSVSLIHTPGHTAGSVCYLIGDMMFTGDTLFDCGIGRCDLPSGNDAEMRRSLSLIRGMEGDFRIFTGHGSNTTLEKQKKYNTYLKNC